ncbi:MAG TPA: 2-oxoglutarate dehydrogenase E1 component [Candidatus Acidoferrales bacterium]|nr:2-oxoglutarate dehydrogenase E1 component [Candidatus Acidoferrales bacterium]
MNFTPFSNLAYLEELYSRYRHDPQSVSTDWQKYFAENLDAKKNGESRLAPSFTPRSIFNPALPAGSRESKPDTHVAGMHERLYELIRNYRTRGHRIAAVNPLAPPPEPMAELALDYYGFSDSELNLLINSKTLPYNTPLTVREIYQRLRNTYSRSIGAQFMHIGDAATRQWLQHRMEITQNRLELSRDEQLRILTRLTDAVLFEEFLRKKFLGAKTFSLEGCETLIPLLDLAVEKAGSQDVRDIVIAMAHRGRLNVLAHIVGKDFNRIFREFTDPEPERQFGGGDVKYHKGHSGYWQRADGQNIHMSLCFNPSHLEFVNPVAMGRTRARQDRHGDDVRRQCLCLLIHGDAAFAGEGIVQETLNLSELGGYTVGGTLHVILNNQIGFTTQPGEYRSTAYATGVARMLQSPIFHVNGEDPEAVAQAVRLSLDFRHEFQKDVFIDMYGYRRLGHNETDEPTFTQPVLYRAISQRKSVRESYFEHLKEMRGVTAEEAEKISQERHDRLERELAVSTKSKKAGEEKKGGIWNGYLGGPEPREETESGIAPEKISRLLRKLSEVPGQFHLHPKLRQVFDRRLEMAAAKTPLDWAAAEALAFASLAEEGVRIRLTGQDSGRGTFSHRHAFLYDYEDGSRYCPLQHLSDKQGPVEIVNSPLCEAGALGFEYGYSLDLPEALVLWEAQFGDFVNAAQVILDQFITSAEDKWRRLSGLVMLLPHGFEGMGPEHSSARIERFLTLAAEDNIQIVQPTTPAQMFHLLRRQSLRKWRKPLVVFTPKSLLRHPKVVSPLEEFSSGHFHKIIPDDLPPQNVTRVLLCTGKIYYELLAFREQLKRNDIAIIRLEQLYPLRDDLLEKTLASYRDGTPVLWVQEEPFNMGAWRYLHEKFGKHLFGRLPFAPISRHESASPATGSSGAHKLEQQLLIERAFGHTGHTEFFSKKAKA